MLSLEGAGIREVKTFGPEALCNRVWSVICCEMREDLTGNRGEVEELRSCPGGLAMNEEGRRKRSEAGDQGGVGEGGASESRVG